MNKKNLVIAMVIAAMMSVSLAHGQGAAGQHASVVTTWANFVEAGLNEVLAATPSNVLTSAEIARLSDLRDAVVVNIASARAWILLSSAFVNGSPTEQLYLSYAADLIMASEMKVQEMCNIVFAPPMIDP